MKVVLRYAAGVTLAIASASAPAEPMFSVSAGTGAPGTKITVSLNHEPTVDLAGAVVFVEFAAGLDFFSATHGSLFPTGTVVTLTNQGAASFILTISANDLIQDGLSGSLVDVIFDIGPKASGSLPVSFRCVPSDPTQAADLVTDQESANDHCFDYAIPLTMGSVTVSAPSNGQVPAPGTASLALLGLGLIGWMWRRRSAT